MAKTDPKAWKGIGMEGWVARWYAKTRSNDIEEFRASARDAADELPRGARVLEVAPGPGFFSIELAKLGDYRITGLDVSRTMVEIAGENARKAGVNVEFRQGNASAMPFADESFDFVYSSAAFKNFTEPVKALDELYRVLRPDGLALIHDLRGGCSRRDIDRYVKQSGRGTIDTWMTAWIFRHVLLRRAYTPEDFVRMSEQSRFGECGIDTKGIGVAVRFAKAGARVA